MPSRKALNKAQHAFRRTLQTQGPVAAQVALDRRGGQLPPEMKERAQGMIDQAKRNMGGPIMGYNMGGYLSPEEEAKKRMMMQQKARGGIASTNVQNAPLAPQKPGMAGGGGQRQQNPLKEIGMGIAKKALMSSLGPVGALFGGLFNKGGQVPPVKRNMGGPLANPHGYNEGGQTMETPTKKVMDEQKLEQQAKAFELEQQRKQEAHNMAMKQKQQQFALSQKMKQESATTNKTPTKPKSPLSK